MVSMQRMTNKRAAAICSAIGHNPAGIAVTDRRDEFPDSVPKHWFHCSCGYRSTARSSIEQALGAGIHHMHLEANKAISNGVSVDDSAVASA